MFCVSLTFLVPFGQCFCFICCCSFASEICWETFFIVRFWFLCRFFSRHFSGIFFSLWMFMFGSSAVNVVVHVYFVSLFAHSPRKIPKCVKNIFGGFALRAFGSASTPFAFVFVSREKNHVLTGTLTLPTCTFVWLCSFPYLRFLACRCLFRSCLPTHLRRASVFFFAVCVSSGCVFGPVRFLDFLGTRALELSSSSWTLDGRVWVSCFCVVFVSPFCCLRSTVLTRTAAPCSHGR